VIKAAGRGAEEAPIYQKWLKWWKKFGFFKSSLDNPFAHLYNKGQMGKNPK
jgi:hypothetical protein